VSELPARAALPPELSPRRRRGGGRRLVRALSWVAALTSLVVLLGSGGTYLWVKVKFSDLRTVTIDRHCLLNCTARPTEVGRTENFLLVGSDSRAGANGQGDLAGLKDATTGGARSDTTMLVHLSADRQKVFILSFPRDTLVTVPTFTDPKTGASHGGFLAKFNTAYALGSEYGIGPAIVTEQVEQMSGLRVDHYLEVDFAGFQNMVNALGGINVCLAHDTRDPGDPSTGSGGSGFVGTKGINHLNGERALQFVRQRDGLPGSDLGRINRQQRFLSAMVREVKSAGTLLNPFKLNAFINAVTSDVKIDKDTTPQDLLALAQKLRNLDPSRVQFITVPVGDPYTPNNRIGSVVPLKPEAQHIFQAIHDDEDPNAPPKPAASPSAGPGPGTAPLPPGQVTVTVANGSGENGKGRSVSADLERVGFKVTAPTTVSRTDPGPTEIHYGSGRQESAQTLAAAVPGARLVPDASGGSQSLVLVVGTDYAGARPVTVAGAPSTAAPPPSAPASPPPKVPTVNAADAECGP